MPSPNTASSRVSTNSATSWNRPRRSPPTKPRTPRPSTRWGSAASGVRLQFFVETDGGGVSTEQGSQLLYTRFTRKVAEMVARQLDLFRAGIPDIVYRFN